MVRWAVGGTVVHRLWSFLFPLAVGTGSVRPSPSSFALHPPPHSLPPPRPTVVPRHRDEEEEETLALSTDDASCGSSPGSTKSEKNMADFDEVPEQPKIQTAVLGHPLVRSHRSLVRLLQTARFAHALRCARSLRSLPRSWDSE